MSPDRPRFPPDFRPILSDRPFSSDGRAEADWFSERFREALRNNIIREVNEHQKFIAAWRKHSFKERCRMEKRLKRKTRCDHND